MNGRPWTAEEDEVLERMLGDHRSSEIAKRLKVPVARVNNRIARLGLSRRVVGVYSANELQAILGLEGNWIRQSLLDTGILVGERVAGRGRFGVFQVSEADLIKFLGEHPHLVDRRRIEGVYRQFVPELWITLGEVFRRGGPHIVTLEHVYRAGYLPEARRRGLRIVVPEGLLPTIVERRRTQMGDVEQQRQWRIYAATQMRALPGRRRRWTEQQIREALGPGDTPDAIEEAS